MKLGFCAIAALAVSATVATTVVTQAAEDPKVINAAIKARQAQMQLFAFNLGQLGGMAKGQIDYDPAQATAAAANLAALSKLDQSQLWPKGSDTETLGKDKTEALAKIWESGSTIGDKGLDLVKAAEAMNAVAGNGLEALQGAIGSVGKSCGSCHKAYRVE